MRLIVLTAAMAGVFLCSAASSDAKELRKQNQFLDAVAGKKLVSGDTWLVISPDGKISGVGRNNAKLTGAWAWSKKFWCRNVVVGDKAFPEDCLKVSIDGNQVTFARNKGKGDAIIYTIAD